MWPVIIIDNQKKMIFLNSTIHFLLKLHQIGFAYLKAIISLATSVEWEDQGSKRVVCKSTLCMNISAYPALQELRWRAKETETQELWAFEIASLKFEDINLMRFFFFFWKFSSWEVQRMKLEKMRVLFYQVARAILSKFWGWFWRLFSSTSVFKDGT